MRIVLTLTAALFAAAGCGPQASSELQSRMQQRLEAHVDFALTAQDPGEVLRESERYCDEMGEMATQMSGAEGCPCCGEGGQMMRARMQEQVEDHRARMREMGELSPMRAECEAHRERMGPMMGEGRGMGGSMMGLAPLP